MSCPMIAENPADAVRLSTTVPAGRTSADEFASPISETFSRNSRVAFVVHYKAVNTSLDQYDIDDVVELQDLIEELYDRFLRKNGCDI